MKNAIARSETLNRGWVYTDRIHENAAGQSVLAFYASRYSHSTRAVWRERIESGAVRLNGKPTAPETLLRRGHVLAYHRAPWREPRVPRSFGLLYEDTHIIAAAKPSGLPVLPGGHHLENTLLSLVRNRYTDRPPPSPLHRLGRATSGIVLFARTSLAKRALSEDLREGRITKIYRALARGVSGSETFEIKTPIGRVAHPGIDYLYAANPEGRPSTTECRVLHRDLDNGCTLLEVRILTGRPHQIRIHLAAAGQPLAGDPLYGAGGRPIDSGRSRQPLPGDGGYHLHAHRVGFLHPAERRTLTLTCVPPPVLRTNSDLRAP